MVERCNSSNQSLVLIVATVNSSTTGNKKSYGSTRRLVFRPAGDRAIAIALLLKEGYSPTFPYIEESHGKW
jgi:hypothetical protein